MIQPSRLKCAGDGKLEKNDMFSNNMLKKRQFNPNAQITCRKHTAGPATELLCSNCRKHKPVTFFSNAERKSSGGQRCRACVEWMENDEPGHAPLPAPNSAREEVETKPYAQENSLNLAFVDDDDDDDDFFVTDAQDDGFSGSWVGRSKESTGAKSGDGLTASNLQSLTNSAGNSRSASSRGVSSYHASSAPTDGGSTAGTELTARPSEGRQFNAYGPDGQFQKRQAGTAASVASGTSRNSSGRNAWAKVPARKTGPSLPRHLEYENPEFVGHEDYDDDDSSDGC